MTRETREAITETIGIMGLSIAIFLMAFGSWTWAADIRLDDMTAIDAIQQRDIAVTQAQVENLDRRMTDQERRLDTMEGRLFGLLLTSVGAVLASTISSIFSIRTHRRVSGVGGIQR